MRWLVVALCLLSAPIAAQVPDDVEPALLTASVNGKPTGEIAILWQRDGAWHAEASMWKSLGLVLQPHESTLPSMDARALGVGVAVDDVALTVDLIVPVERLPKQLLGSGIQMPELSDPAPGVLVNYNIAAQSASGQHALSLGHEFRTAGRWGMLITSGQANWANGRGADYIRGHSRWQLDDYKRLVTYQVGDVISGGTTGAWLGGARIAKDHSLDPYQPTYPIPFIGGLALDATIVQILADKAKVAEHDVGKGEFTVERFPLRSGRNSLDVVVRDAFGREQIIRSEQLYFSPAQFRKGLSAWSVAAGAVRQGSSDDYGKIGASIDGSYGLTDTWTLTGSAQADESSHNAVVGARTVLGAVGTLELKVGQSMAAAGKGSYAKATYHYAGPRMGIAVSHERSDQFWQLSSNDAASLQAKDRTQAAVTWRSEDGHWRGRVGGTALTTAHGGVDRRLRFAEVGMGWHSGAHSLTASGLYDLDQQSTSVALGYRLQLGTSSIGAGARRAPDISRVALLGTYQTHLAGTPVSMRGELAQTNGDNQVRVSADARLINLWARVEARQEHGDTTINGEFAGAVHVGRGGMTWLPNVSGGYAVVDVAGVAGVPLLANGRVVGTTNRAGRVVVTGIQDLVATPIRVDDRALPVGVQLASSELTLASRRLVGGRADFKVLAREGRAFTIKRKIAIEPGSLAKSSNEEAPVGFDGALYLSQPVAGDTVVISDATGTCSAVLPSPLLSPTDLPVIDCQ